MGMRSSFPARFSYVHPHLIVAGSRDRSPTVLPRNLSMNSRAFLSSRLRTAPHLRSDRSFAQSRDRVSSRHSQGAGVLAAPAGAARSHRQSRAGATSAGNVGLTLTINPHAQLDVYS